MDGARKRRMPLSVVPGDVEHLRPVPPPVLTKEAAEEWRRIVKRMPADHFAAETWPMLIALCRHVEQSNDIARVLEANPLDMKEGVKSIKAQALMRNMLAREHRMIAVLSTKLRLTPLSRHETVKDRRKAEREPTFRSPADVDDEISYTEAAVG